MTKVLLTGLPGCGKTTTVNFLTQNGITAFDTDEIEGATCLENIETGKVIEWPEGQVDWGGNLPGIGKNLISKNF